MMYDQLLWETTDDDVMSGDCSVMQVSYLLYLRMVMSQISLEF